MSPPDRRFGGISLSARYRWFGYPRVMEQVRPFLKERTRILLESLARGAGLTSRLDRLAAKVNASQSTQVMLTMLYKDRVERGGPLPTFDEVEFRVHSQNGEDGILLYIFALLGNPTKRCVEICAGDGIECNTANLIVNHGWRGFLIDGRESNIQTAKEFYGADRSTLWFPPAIKLAWVTAENVNDLLKKRGFTGQVDLLSLDLDGIDYWIWKALDVVSPRVVVTEFNWGWGPDESVTVPYDPAFRIDKQYFGASLAAYAKLAREKGYRLVGCQRWGFNAFFVQSGVGEDVLPEVSPAECFDTPVMRMRWTPEFRERLRAKGEWVPV